MIASSAGVSPFSMRSQHEKQAAAEHWASYKATKKGALWLAAAITWIPELAKQVVCMGLQPFLRLEQATGTALKCCDLNPSFHLRVYGI